MFNNEVYYIIIIIPLDDFTILIFLINKFNNKEKKYNNKIFYQCFFYLRYKAQLLDPKLI